MALGCMGPCQNRSPNKVNFNRASRNESFPIAKAHDLLKKTGLLIIYEEILTPTKVGMETHGNEGL